MADKRRRCPVAHYAQQVVEGKITAGRLVKLACQRHLDDLSGAHARGLYFDRDAAEHAIEKIQIFRHSKGEWGGKQLTLSDWQCFIIGNIYGWKRADGTRRFRTLYGEVARKNGKSTTFGGICNYMLYFDGEQGAEIYTAATKRDQARIVFDEAVNMLRKMPDNWAIRRKTELFSHSVAVPDTASKMMPLSADANTMDGLNPHLICIDELHAHKDRKVFDVLNTALGARRQPLLAMITTAGWDRNSICWQQHEYAVKVLEKIFDDDSFFAYVATIDDGDDWRDPKVWMKANPNLGISVKEDYLQRQCEKAMNMPAELNSFLRLHLNVWTEQADRWIDMADWDACGDEYGIDDLLGRDCFGALDMSSTQDISAFSLTFPPVAENECWKQLHWFFVPKDNIRKRAERDRVDYDVWVRQGFIEATDGNVVDYNHVEQRILDVCELFNVREVAYDRWNVTQMVTNLQGEGVNMVQYGQGFASMSAPTKMLEDLIVSKKVAHNKNPVLRWMISNVAIREDAAGNKKPDKERSSEKIDGVVTMVMGLGRAIIAPEEKKSYTANNGIVFI